jgi:hypothetical protein
MCARDVSSATLQLKQLRPGNFTAHMIRSSTLSQPLRVAPVSDQRLASRRLALQAVILGTDGEISGLTP